MPVTQNAKYGLLYRFLCKGIKFIENISWDFMWNTPCCPVWGICESPITECPISHRDARNKAWVCVTLKKSLMRSVNFYHRVLWALGLSFSGLCISWHRCSVILPGYWKIPGYLTKNTRVFFSTPVLLTNTRVFSIEYPGYLTACQIPG